MSDENQQTNEQTTQTEQTSEQTAEQQTEQTQEQQTEQTSEQTQEQEQQTETPAPLTVESFTIPEGMEAAPDEVKQEFVDILNDAEKSPQERAQALVDLQSKLMTQAAEDLRSAWDEQQSAWQKEVEKDPELGGTKMSENLAQVSKLIDTYGSTQSDATKRAEEVDALRKALDYTGAGNHPAIIKFLFRVSKDLSEGGPVSGQPAPTSQSLAQKMFPSMKE